MQKLITEALDEAKDAGLSWETDSTIKWAMWYRQHLMQKKITARPSFRPYFERSRFVTRVYRGRMYMYRYRLTREDLEIQNNYDRQPLIILMHQTPSDLWGINLHFIPRVFRGIYFDRLMKFGQNLDSHFMGRLLIRMSFLRSGKLAVYRQAIRHYKRDKIMTRMVQIYPEEWKLFNFLPLSRFYRQLPVYV